VIRSTQRLILPDRSTRTQRTSRITEPTMGTDSSCCAMRGFLQSRQCCKLIK
jgi:hypothetical protein